MRFIFDAYDLQLIRNDIEEERPSYSPEQLSIATSKFIDYMGELSRENRLDFHGSSAVGELEFWLENIEQETEE